MMLLCVCDVRYKKQSADSRHSLLADTIEATEATCVPRGHALFTDLTVYGY